jgi:hypothetical protein
MKPSSGLRSFASAQAFEETTAELTLLPREATIGQSNGQETKTRCTLMSTNAEAARPVCKPR